MSSVVRRRAGHKSEATRLMNHLKTLCNAVPANYNEILTYMQELIRRRDIIIDLDDQVQKEIVDEEKLNADMQSSSNTLIAINATITSVEKLLPKQQNISTGDNERNLTVKLPTIQLPTFSGSPLDWQNFWDIFNASIHKRTDIANASKFNYLLSQLEGEAAQLLRGFHHTDAEYSEAVELLKKTYGNVAHQIEAHLHAILDLPTPRYTSTELSAFRSSYEGHLRGLKSLGKDIDAAGFVLTSIILRKLPLTIRNNMNREGRKDHWDLESLRGAIEIEIGHLKAAEHAPNAAMDIDSYEYSFQPNRNNSTMLSITSNQRKCYLCTSPHHTVFNCDKYTTVNDRRVQAMRERLCFNCLRSSHQIRECQSTIKCKNCSLKHHTLLCTNPKKSYYVRNETTSATIQSERRGSQSTLGEQRIEPLDCTSAAAATNHTISKHKTTLLPTAIVEIGNGNLKCKIRALFDLGSQRTFILNNISSYLDLKTVNKVNLAIDGFCSKIGSKMYDIVQFKIYTNNEEIISDAVVVDKLPNNLFMPGRSNFIKNILEDGIKLADSTVDSDRFSDICLLVGADQYYNFVYSDKIGGLSIIPSKFGAMLSGPIDCEINNNEISVESVTMLKVGISNDSLSEQLKQFWHIEAVDENTVDKNSFDNFKNCVRYEENHFIAKLPWRDSHPQLPLNYMLAYRRLKSNLISLRKKPDIMRAYNNVIGSQLNSNFIEIVQDIETENRCHYLPHHCVLKQSETTPVRVVFDCSSRAKESLHSLNDCLFSGPPLLNELVGVFLRFRYHKYACVSDIEKAFLMVELDEEDRDVTRFLWPEDPNDPQSKLIVYRFRVVLFGATCSQALLNVSIKVLLDSCNDPIANKISNGLYVDNLLYSTNCKLELARFYERSCSIMKSGNFNLREWITNDIELNSTIAFDKLLSKSKDNIGVLGMNWNVNLDSIEFNLHKIDIDVKHTKRSILSEISKIYDPFGLLLPVTIRARIMMQTLWKSNIGWDEPLDGEIISIWKELAADLNDCQGVTMDRSLCLTDTIDLYCFCDASTKAYGTIVYAKVNNQLKFLIARARVAPLKTVTLPYLELMAAHSAAKLMKFVSDSLKEICRYDNMFIYSDSEIVLSWISNCRNIKKCVQQRVENIHKLVPHVKWFHIKGTINPSDCLTRGISADEYFRCSVWFNGPNIPYSEDFIMSRAVETEKVSSNIISVDNVELKGFECLLSRFSDYSRMLGVFKFIFKFINTLCRKIIVNNIFDIEVRIIKQLHATHFTSVLKYFRQPDNSTIPNLVKQLNLIVDGDIVRCAGRLQNSNLSIGAKYPILLPTYSNFTDMLIDWYHLINLHAGVNYVLSSIRNKFWIIKGRQRIKSRINRCIICKRYQARPLTMPTISPLPQFRVENSKPFQICGIDYTGHFNVKYRDSMCRVYVCLFTCMSTRAIHLELVEGADAETFMFAFRRFISRKACPSLIVSDNAQIFKAASVHLSKHRIEWKFIPSRAPHFGGVWERLIGLTKLCMKKLLGKNLVNLVELQTVLCQVECQINNRPLTYVSNDINDEPITPSLLLCGRNIESISNEYVDCNEILDPSVFDKSIISKRFKFVQDIVRKCWLMWKNDYLKSLRERDRNLLRDDHKLCIGDIVLIWDESPRSNWCLGKIEELYTSSDKVVRSVKLKTKGGYITRPVVKLINLEIHSSSDHVDPNIHHIDESIASVRPKRQAASRAREALSNIEY